MATFGIARIVGPPFQSGLAASLEETPIEILLWEIPLKSQHIRRPAVPRKTVQGPKEGHGSLSHRPFRQR